MSDGMSAENRAIIARECVENTAQLFFAYLAARRDYLGQEWDGELVKHFGAFTNEVWRQCNDVLREEHEKNGGR